MAADFLATIRYHVIRPLIARLPNWVTPNGITVARLLLLVPLWVLLGNARWGDALLVYLVAISTDALDGELARLRGAESDTGAWLDPLVDKLLHVSVFLVFFGTAPLLLGLTILLEALTALGALYVALRRTEGVAVQAGNYGKWKVLLQVLATTSLFLYAMTAAPVVAAAARVFLGVVILMGALAMLEYVRRHRPTHPSPTAAGR